MENPRNASPLLLEKERFTPPTRTPWGGHRIRRLKGLEPGPIVGESWELSIEPSFPSHLEDGRTLHEVVGDTALLVKLLDAAEALSVQIHPSDEAPGLGFDEGGKPEAWYVVDRDPGAGIYLGLAEGADETSVRRVLEEGGDLSTSLPFVPVEPGDFFSIEAGTPHCVGAGVFLVEPQRVQPGRRGVTYRYWDWNRTYDASGQRDPDGEPRALHVEEALAVTRWDLPRGASLLDRVRVRAGAPDLRGPALWHELPGPPPLEVRRLSGTGTLTFEARSAVSGITVLAGHVELGDLRVEAGRSAAIPPGWTGRARLEDAHGIFSVV